MTKLTLRTSILATLLLCVPAFAAGTASDFYLGLLQRGIADADKGRYAESVTPLRLAAFGLVESVPLYQTAQAYLAISYERMNQPDDAREAAQRVVVAERIERKFASLTIPVPIRTAFESIARKHLSGTDMALLTTTASAPLVAAVEVKPTAPVTAPAPARNETVPPPPSKPTPAATTPEKPAAAPAQQKPASVPAQTSNTPVNQASEKATAPQPKPQPAPPAVPQPKASQPASEAANVAAKLAAGERALAAANLTLARGVYRELLGHSNLDHGTWIRVAEGLYRSREFAGALQAFKNAGSLRPGEEAYGYYIAVCLFETGNYAAAKSALTSALPYIELTPDVERYRSRIESAGN